MADLTAHLEDFDRCVMQRDRGLAEQTLHPDYALVLVHPVPAVVSREQWLALLPDYVVHGYEVQERIVHEEGDAAAVLQRIDMRATVMGEDRSGIFVTTEVWQRTGEAWTIWRRHSTPLSAGVMPEGS